MSGDYMKAQEVFGKTLHDYISSLPSEPYTEPQLQEMGNLEFRYGWALIRSKKDMALGIQNLRNADDKLADNCDLKLKLA